MAATSPAVALSRAETYDHDRILDTLRRQAQMLGIPAGHFAGRRVVIKPNLVAPLKPEAAATTHPVFLTAVVDFLREYGADDLLLAESPGGLYSEATLRMNYKNCGILEAAEKCGLRLNYDTDAVPVQYGDGIACRSFHVIRPIAEADVIVDLCRLKSHSLTRLSCAVKNFFGVIPGVEKFEMHSAYPALPVFSEMIVDLCAMLCASHEILAICDGITAMEGNGPTGGTPRNVGAVLMSRDPFALDAAAEAVIGFAGTVSINEAARKRGLCPKELSGLPVLGDSIDSLTVKDFREPDASGGKFLRNLPDMFGGRLANFFSPRPEIDKENCIGCGVCAKSCPRHAIVIAQKQGRKQAVISRKDCIRCYCCQELCPIHAVKIHKNPIFKIIR